MKHFLSNMMTLVTVVSHHFGIDLIKIIQVFVCFDLTPQSLVLSVMDATYFSLPLIFPKDPTILKLKNNSTTNKTTQVQHY